MTVHAIRCPQCSAMLDVRAGASMLRCSFCSTPCRVDWTGSDPVLSEEAAELARLLGGIDFDALEQGLEELEEYVDQQNAKGELAAAVERLEQHEQIERLAAQLAASGKTQEFIQGVSKLEIDETEEHEVLLRNLLSRVAVRAATQANDIETRTPPVSDNVMQHSGTGDANRAWTPSATSLLGASSLNVDHELGRQARRWLWLPWIGLLLLPLMVIGLAMVLAVVVAAALPKHEDRPWLGLAFVAAVLSSPIAGIGWLWIGLKRRKALVARRRAMLGRDALG